MPVIENDILRVTILEQGAELKAIYNKETKLDYLWDANPAFWAKSSPVLFPIVGTLKADTYFYKGRPYHLGRHGFARETLFTVESHDAAAITLLLRSNDTTLLRYPFSFEFRISYKLTDDQLSTSYHVTNTGKEPMYFSVGGHPAFRVPLDLELSYTDYQLEFEKPETVGRWMISREGLIENQARPLLDNTNILPLTHELFYKDAVVLKGLASGNVRLVSGRSPHGLAFDFTGFPFLGVWAAKDADFVCIEPWCGIADSVDSMQDLATKEGIESLDANGVFLRSWSVRLF